MTLLEHLRSRRRRLAKRLREDLQEAQEQAEKLWDLLSAINAKIDAREKLIPAAMEADCSVEEAVLAAALEEKDLIETAIPVAATTLSTLQSDLATVNALIAAAEDALEACQNQ